MTEKSKNLLKGFIVTDKPSDDILIVPSMLSGRVGRIIYDEVIERKESLYANHHSFGNLDIDPLSTDVTSQTLYSAIELESVLRDNGLRGMNFGDIKYLKDKNFPFNSKYYDLGIVFRGVGSVKPNLSLVLEKQLKERGFNVDRKKFSDGFPGEVFYTVERPIFIPTGDLENVLLEENGIRKMSIKLRNDANPMYFPSLGHSNKGKNISGFDSNGPVFEATKQPIQYISNDNGTSKVLLRGLSRLDTSNGGFSIGASNGRTIIFKK